MHLGIFAKTFSRPTLEETLDTVARLGLTHVQFNMSCVGLPTLPERIDEDLCRSIARAHRDRDLTMAAISGTFNLCDPDTTRLDDNLRRLGVLAGACRWVDTRTITLCTGTLDPEDMWNWHPENVRRSTWQALGRSVREAVKIADRYEVTLAFEPEIHNVVDSTMRARRLLEEVGSPWLKVVIDPTNLFRPGEPRPLSEILDEAFDWLGPDIVLAHAKPPSFEDDPDCDDWLGEFLGRSYSTQLGTLAGLCRDTGVELPSSLRADLRIKCFFEPYFGALREIGYDGAIIIHGVGEDEAGSMSSVLRRSDR